MKAKVKETETVRIERQRAADIGWSEAAAAAINEMEVEYRDDVKKFYNQSNGSARARGMVETLKTLETRLHKFVRAD